MVSLSILAYVTFIGGAESAYGDRWVHMEFVLLKGTMNINVMTNDVPLQFKPITGFMVSSAVWCAAGLQGAKSYIQKHELLRASMRIGAYALSLVSLYELWWNFAAFTAILSAAAAPSISGFEGVVDSVTFHYSYGAVNAIFATKIFALMLFVGLCTIYELDKKNAKFART